MVTQSNHNYSKWKHEFGNYYYKKFGIKHKKVVDKFMEKISILYDKHEKAFIPHQLMWYLNGQKRWVKKNNAHFWIAFIGQKGGEGKSTLAKNILYFLDPTFSSSRISLNYDEMIDSIYDAKSRDKLEYPSILLDEQENKTHVMSKKGREMKDIITRIRQFNMFVGVCANSLQEIPPFLYERLTCIVHINDKHTCWLWDKLKDKPKYTIIDNIKSGFKKEGHSIFKDSKICDRAYLKRFCFSEYVPYDEGNYHKKKEEDLLNDIKNFRSNGKPLPEDVKSHVEVTNEQIIEKMEASNPNLRDGDIAFALNISREWANRLRQKVRKKKKASKCDVADSNSIQGRELDNINNINERR